MTTINPPKNQRRFHTPWGELQYVCRKMHYWLYRKNNRVQARRYLARLERVLGRLPDNDMAIIRAEALALLHELKGDRNAAIKYRRREIQLMEMLHKDVESQAYDADLRAWILAGCDAPDLQERRRIVQALQDDAAQGSQRLNGKS